MSNPLPTKTRQKNSKQNRMKNTAPTLLSSIRSKILPGLASVALLATLPSAHADTYDWSGATNGNMTGTPANWGGTVPTGADIARWNAATYTTPPTANGNMTIGQLLFDAGNTNGVTFGTGASTLTLNGISGTGIQMNSGSGAVSTGSAKFALGASQSWINNDNSLLTVTGTITNADNTTAKILTIDGTGNTTLSGVISNNTGGATTAITKNGTGTLAIGSSSNNTFTGGLTLNAGTVSFGNTGSLGSGNVTVNGGSFLGGAAGTATTSTVTGYALNSDLTYASTGASWNTGTGAVSLGAANIAITNNSTGAGALTVGGNITGASNLTLNAIKNITLTSANNTGTITVLNATNIAETTTIITTMGSNVTSLTMGSGSSGSTTTVSNIVVNSAGTTLTNDMTAGTGRALKIGNTTGTGDLVINNNATVGTLMVQSSGFVSNLGSINHTGNLTYGGTGSATWGVVNMNIGSNVVNVSKDHSAQLNLNGVNTYTGTTTVSKGVLALTGSFASSGDYIANTGGKLYVDFSSGLATGSGNQTNKVNPAADLQLGGGTLEVQGASNKAAVANTSWTGITTAGLPSGQVRLTFAVAPAVVVGQPITATGISAGSYVVRIDGTGVIVASSTTPAATGTDFAAAATTTTLSSQTFASTTLNAGASEVKANLNTGSGTAINLGGITRNVGSTVYFNTNSASNSILTSTGTASTILTASGVAYATGGISGTQIDWAAKNAGNTAIVGLSTLSGYTTTNATTITGNADLNTNTTLAANATSTSIRNNSTTARTINLGGNTLTTGGILSTSNVSGTGGFTMRNGTLTSAATVAGKDLVIIQNGTGSAGVTINAVIADSTAGSTGLTKSGTGTVTLGGNNTFTGNTIVNQGNITLTNNLALQNSAVDTAGSGTIALSSTNTPTLGGLIGSKNLASVITSGTSGVTSLTLNPGTGVTNSYSGAIANLGSGAMALNKSGAGTQILSGTNTYNGTITVSGGTLLISGTSANSGSFNVNTGTLNYTNAAGWGSGQTVNVNGGTFRNNGGNFTGTLAFTSGTVGGSNLGGQTLTIGANQTLSPGNSTGDMSAGATTWANSGTFKFEINDATGTAGSTTNGWDLLNPTTLDITAGVGQFTIDLTTLTAGQVAGLALNFVDTTSYSWLFVDAGADITGFAANKFAFADNFQNTTTGTFSIAQGGAGNLDKLFISYTVIPEPSTYAMVLGGLAALILLRRRRNS